MTKQARKRVVSIKSILTPEQMRILRLRFRDQLTEQEIGVRVGISRRTVYYRIEAAFASIRSCPGVILDLD